MDNVCHTLIGAAIGEAGMKRLTRYGSATLMIASNLPDIDVLSMATSVPAVSFRRGWTHGILAQAVLPIVLALLVMGYGRFTRTNPRFLPLLSLSYIGVTLHVLFDLMNNYGIRLLMPYSSHWFYGDVLFIVDPWLYLLLGGGVWLARQRGTPAHARRALIAAAAYVLVMIVSARAARATVLDQWTSGHGAPPHKLMVGPVFASPFHKQVIVDDGETYHAGRFSWLSRGVDFEERVPKNEQTTAAAVAQRDAFVRAVLVWARFPYYTIERGRVTLSDMRFGRLINAVSVVVSPDS